MEYKYVAISGHPDDVISLSIGNEAELYALAHYKGSLRRGLNPSTSGVQQNVTCTTSNDDTATKGCSSSSGTVPDGCNQGSTKGCSSSSGTAHDDTLSAKENEQKQLSSSSETEIRPNSDPDDSAEVPKRCRSREAIRRRRRLYKIRKRNNQQKHLKSPQKFEYRELTITRYFQ